LHNRVLKWIDLHEAHGRNRLSEVDPFPDCMATSSPFGDFGDGDIELWGTLSRGRIPAESPLEFRDRAEFIRCRLTMLLKTVEAFPKPPPMSTNGVANVLPELRVLYSDFRSLRNSPLAWQSIDAGDAQLLSKAATALRESGIR
jgi:hypothetical protein